MARPGGLGKGLGALIPAGASSPDGRRRSGLQEIAVVGDPAQPVPARATSSTRRRSARSPTRSVRSACSSRCWCARSGDGYELIAGERRWRAARRVGLQTIPALVRETDDASALEQALVENLQREDLNPLEEAAAYQQLIEDFGLTHEQVAARAGTEPRAVSNTLRLLQLPPVDPAHGPGAAAHAWATPVRCSARPTGRSRSSSPGRSSRRTCRSARSRRPFGSTTTRGRRRRRRRGRRAAAGSCARPGSLELEELLGDHLETRVKISMNAPRGRVVVDFAGLEDLERIYRLLTEGCRAEPAERRRRTDCARQRLVGLGRLRRVARCPAGCRDDGAGDVADRRATRARMASTSSRGHELADDRRHARLRGARRRRVRTRRPPASTALELGVHRAGDHQARFGPEPARLEVRATSTRDVTVRASAKQRSARERVRRPGEHDSSSPEASSTAVARRLRRARARRRRRARRARASPRRTPAGPSRRRGPWRSSSRSRTAGDRARRERADPVEARADGRRSADPVGREPGAALELDERRRGVVAEDAVDAAGVEAERVQPALELGDVVAAQHRLAAVQSSRSPRREAALDERGPGVAVRHAVDPQPPLAPGTPAPRARCRRRTTRARRARAVDRRAPSRRWRSRTALWSDVSGARPDVDGGGPLRRRTRRGPGGAGPCPWRRPVRFVCARRP